MISILISALLSAGPFPGVAVELPACSVARTAADYIRGSGDTWAVAEILRDSVTDATAFQPMAELSRDTTSVHRGHLIRIQTSTGHASDGAAARGSVAAVFWWGFGMDCRLYSSAFGESVSGPHHFTMTLRPESAWVDDRPTFDVTPFGLGIYAPNAALGAETLNVADYTEMVSLIPDQDAWSQDCRPGVRELNRWMWDHGRPFKRIIEGLVGLCEGSIADHAYSYVRDGPATVPAAVDAWASRSGCSVSAAWSGGPVNAVRGQLLPGSAMQWAVICAYPDSWRLVVLDDAADREIVELARLKGSPDSWQVSVASPQFFDWAPLGLSDDDPDRLPNPEYEAVLLSSGTDTVFYVTSGSWTGLQHGCCPWRY